MCLKRPGLGGGGRTAQQTVLTEAPLKTTDARREEEGGWGGSVCPCVAVWVSAQLRALEPLRMCLHGGPLFQQQSGLGRQLSNPGYMQPHTGSYPLACAHCLHSHANTPHTFTST